MTTVDDLHKQWDEESRIDFNNLGEEAVRQRRLHSKYNGLLLDAQRNELRSKQLRDKAYKAIKAYYLGHLSDKQIKELGWEPVPLKIMRNDVDEYINADDRFQKVDTMYLEAKITTKFIENCLQELRGRDYTIKNAIDWQKLMTGA